MYDALPVVEGSSITADEVVRKDHRAGPSWPAAAEGLETRHTSTTKTDRIVGQ